MKKCCELLRIRSVQSILLCEHHNEMTVKSFVRNNFFAGRLLTADDLALEQNYFREKQKLHNRALHGFGVVSGLDVIQRPGKLIITAGLAIDCQGNEIVVEEPVELSLPQSVAGSSTYLRISYHENESGSVPTEETGESSCSLRIEEKFIADFSNVNLNQHHRHVKGRWQACGTPHGLLIARLRFTAEQWRLDRRFHRPAVK